MLTEASPIGWAITESLVYLRSWMQIQLYQFLRFNGSAQQQYKLGLWD